MEKVKAYPTIDNIGRNNYELIGKDIEPKSKWIRSSHSQITALNKSMPPRNSIHYFCNILENEISYNYAKENWKKDLENTSWRVSQKGSSKRYHLRSPSEIKSNYCF